MKFFDAPVRCAVVAGGIVVIAVATFFASAVATYHIAVWVAPPRTADGHPVMPVGQVFIAGVAATAVTTVLVIALSLIVRRRR